MNANKLIPKFGSPLYVYDGEVIKNKYFELKNSIVYRKMVLHYACKANSNSEILKLLKRLGSNIETVSIGEVELALNAGFKPNQIIFTCSNLSESELKFIAKNRIMINLDSLSQIEKYGKLNPNSEISIRINQGIGAGHHSNVITGGRDSKFGIYPSQINDAKKLASQFGLEIVGIHQHIGSNVLDEKIFMKAVRALLNSARRFKDLKFVDFGGGFGLPYKPNEKALNLKVLGRQISEEFSNFCTNYGRQLTMIFEAGRFLVAESGTLLVTVTDVKRTPFKTFVGVDSGFNHLVRPAMYDAYHEITNLTNPQAKKEKVTVAGNICESGDIFARDRKIAKCKEGDILAIMNTGAYGYSMASNYNSRQKPAEIMIMGNKIKLIRQRE